MAWPTAIWTNRADSLRSPVWRGEPWSASEKLFETYHETREWNEILGVSTVGDLNEHCLNGEVRDIIHITDLFTTFARLGDAMDNIPTDRIIDGLDLLQSQREAVLARRPLFWRSDFNRAVRFGQWKLLHKIGIYSLWIYAFSVYWWALFYYPNPVWIDHVYYWGGFLAWGLRAAAWRKKPNARPWKK